MRAVNSFVVVVDPGQARSTRKARQVTYKLDDAVHSWLVPHRMKSMYIDVWGHIRVRATHLPLLRMIAAPVPATHTLRCRNGDRFDYRKANWEAIEWRRRVSCPENITDPDECDG